MTSEWRRVEQLFVCDEKFNGFRFSHCKQWAFFQSHQSFINYSALVSFNHVVYSQPARAFSTALRGHKLFAFSFMFNVEFPLLLPFMTLRTLSTDQEMPLAVSTFCWYDDESEFFLCFTQPAQPFFFCKHSKSPFETRNFFIQRVTNTCESFSTHGI